MRISTWNVNSLRVRMEHLGRWLADNAVDAIALQELKLADEHFPRAEIEALGLHAACYGQKTYNGVAILSRAEPQDIATRHPRGQRPAAARHRGDHRTRAARERLRAEWPGGRFREIHLQARLARAPARLPRRAPDAARACAGRRRFQHRAGGPRRARPGGLGGLGARERARARSARRGSPRSDSRTSSASSSSPQNPGAGGTTA